MQVHWVVDGPQVDKALVCLIDRKINYTPPVAKLSIAIGTIEWYFRHYYCFVYLGFKLPTGPEGISEGLLWLLARQVQHVTLLLLSFNKLKLKFQIKLSLNKWRWTFEYGCTSDLILITILILAAPIKLTWSSAIWTFKKSATIHVKSSTFCHPTKRKVKTSVSLRSSMQIPQRRQEVPPLRNRAALPLSLWIHSPKPQHKNQSTQSINCWSIEDKRLLPVSHNGSITNMTEQVKWKII